MRESRTVFGEPKGIPGLGLLDQEGGAMTWAILSAPIMPYQTYYNFFYDAFGVIDVTIPITDSTITLYNQNINKKDGFKKNVPLNLNTTDWNIYANALDQCLNTINEFKPDCLIVSLGLDTFENDPMAAFKLKSDDYLKMGNSIASLHLPTLFVFEGGYAIDELGLNTVNVLTGFEGP